MPIYPHLDPNSFPCAARQRGVSLFIVVIILLLSLIAMLGVLQVANLNESLVGNQSDQERSYAAAEALLNAAQRDILLNNGLYCESESGAFGSAGTNATLKQGTGAAPACTVRYPADNAGYMEMLTTESIIGGINKCAAATNAAYKGVCISSSPTQEKFLAAKIDNDGAQTLTNGAAYNQFTASLSDVDWGPDAKAGEATLALGTGNFKGAYWVEVFPYHALSGALGDGVPANVPAPDGTYPFIFRITALAQGLRGGTVSVLRSYYVPYPCLPSAAVGGGCG
ncbi:MAG: hypothetical protein LBV49_08340 [Azonexus sp.]|jgi:type IV pilus assembly protein PilX|nr:hypothetical protein [Azonexus sp.]